MLAVMTATGPMAQRAQDPVDMDRSAPLLIVPGRFVPATRFERRQRAAGPEPVVDRG
jgi:hypothetical protein